jgi:hypothetical protein
MVRWNRFFLWGSSMEGQGGTNRELCIACRKMTLGKVLVTFMMEMQLGWMEIECGEGMKIIGSGKFF